MQTVQLFIICVTVTACLGIICYTISHLLTHETIVKAIKQAARDIVVYDFPKAS